MIFKDKV